MEPDGSTLLLDFQGKAGWEISLDVRDAAVADAIREALELPEWRVPKYVNGDGKRRFVNPKEVNGYISSVTDGPFTVKDLRTWLETVTLVD